MRKVLSIFGNLAQLINGPHKPTGINISYLLPALGIAYVQLSAYNRDSQIEWLVLLYDDMVAPLAGLALIAEGVDRYEPIQNASLIVHIRFINGFEF